MKIVIHKIFGRDLSYFKWYRKWIGGTWYYIFPLFLPIGSFWSQKPITSCGSEIIETEKY